MSRDEKNRLLRTISNLLIEQNSAVQPVHPYPFNCALPVLYNGTLYRLTLRQIAGQPPKAERRRVAAATLGPKHMAAKGVPR